TGNSASGNGVDISGGTNTFNAGNGSIHMEGNRVQMKDSNITAGNFTLNATGTGSEISNSTVNVTDNIALTAVTSTGNSGVYLKNASLTAQNGSVTMEGTATGGGKAVHLDGNVTLTAANGSVIMNGSAASSAGVYVDGSNNTLNASNATIHGQSASGNGFVLKNLSLTGGVADFANVTLSSEGSGSSVTNRIDGGVL
ncbi:TPA: filamentous hemagglutinin, partial [Escherichia coli]|nr:filamentous hemagglutinin [Escherichia coli]HAZ3600671.1 filamentous hemagglutinin [Escherichia coli]